MAGKRIKIDSSRERHFKFLHLEDRECQTLKNKDVKDLLMKWSMLGNLHVQYYSYDQLFQPYQKNEFISDFLQDPAVISTLKVVSDGGSTSPVGMTAAAVEITEVPCTLTSMSVFDRLTDEGIVRDSGHIVKCFDEFVDDLAISDELRKMLLMEDSDNYEAYSDAEREQFLFCLFKHICLGGAVCQYEDMVEPYLTTTKTLYKDLISVVKDSMTQVLKVASTVLKMKAWDKDSFQFYPSDKDHEQTFAYFIIDPLKRHVAGVYSESCLHHVGQMWAPSIGGTSDVDVTFQPYPSDKDHEQTFASLSLTLSRGMLLYSTTNGGGVYSDRCLHHVGQMWAPSIGGTSALMTHSSSTHQTRTTSIPLPTASLTLPRGVSHSTM